MNGISKRQILAAGTSSDARWAAVVARDGAADGQFFYAVRSTGVYCRPSCAARTPRPENVVFHVSADAAEAAGFRACLRCRPNHAPWRHAHAATIAQICRVIEQCDEVPQLKELAAKAGLSPYHFHRLFKEATGVTPRAYAEAHRAQRMRSALQTADSVTDAIYQAGFSSNSRFYDQSDRRLGMTPTKFRAGGADTEIRFALGECSLGSILVAQSERGVCAISLGNNPGELLRELQDRFPKAKLIGGDVDFETVVAKIVGFIEAPRVGLDLPLDIRGTAFQQRVWQALVQVAPGSKVTYAELARRIGLPKSVRAVARACSANALAVAIPCHRVVRSDGDAGGYRWGVERKRALLHREETE